MLKIILFSCLIFLVACVEPTTTEDLSNAPEARLIVAEKIMSPEARALENKIANRTLLQKVVDESKEFQRVEFSFACNNDSGGLLSYIKSDERIQGIRFATSKEGMDEFVGWYYKRDELVFVVHEKGEWLGEQEKNIQTLFYLDNGEVLRCMQKKALGATHQIEKLIQAAEFELVTTNLHLLKKIATYETLFKKEISPKKLAAYFCD